MEQFSHIDIKQELFSSVSTPCYIINSTWIEKNLKILQNVQNQANCKILLAFKGFAMWSLAPLISKYLSGVSASSVNEARLGREEFKGEVHVYAPAYSEKDFKEIIRYADHIVFNSIRQWEKFRSMLPEKTKAGIRINPEHSEVKTTLYDPCASGSRLGITLENMKKDLDALKEISGLHFHNLCELNSDALERTLNVIEDKFSFLLNNIEWINFGGGHHITAPTYDVKKLIDLIQHFKSRYAIDIYLEPGEAIALNSGVLVSSVLDVIQNNITTAILDTSATAHMPDVLEMPYKPVIAGAAEPQQKKYTYRLGGTSCLAGDIIGDYSFDMPLNEGDRLVFADMAHYTMVKNTTFNGINLPSIYLYDEVKQTLELIRKFEYQDFKNRLS